MRNTTVCTALLLGALATGCRSTPEEPAPMDLAGEYDSTLAYLLARHDANGDQVISEREYSRGATAFGRLDRNGDGRICAEDWAEPPRDGHFEDGSPLERSRTRRAAGVLATYFQAGDPGTVTLAELEEVAAAYDTDGDGRVDVEEFTCAAGARAVEVPGEIGRQGRRADEPWEALVTVVDDDEDGAVALAELAALFERADDRGDGVWVFEASSRGGRERRSGDREQREPPAVGVVAPDFTLSSPDGKERVTLSDHAGERPVALIFGSYT